jgi:hypothetical protein
VSEKAVVLVAMKVLADSTKSSNNVSSKAAPQHRNSNQASRALIAAEVSVSVGVVNARLALLKLDSQSKANAAELRTLQSMESRIEQVAAVIGKAWKDGECQIAKKVDPNRSAKMADQIKAMMSALTVMEYDLRKASAAADLLQGMQ